MKKNRAVFLDRDGTINRDVGYPNSYGMIEIYPYSIDAVRKINQAGFLAVVVTNQAGIGKGFIEEKNLVDIHRKLSQDFAKSNASFAGIYYCPHYEQSQIPAYRKKCSCRKPNAGMAQQAVIDLDIDTERSYMIGDKAEDILFGLNIQATPILLRTGYGKKSLSRLKELGIEPAFVAETLKEAVDWILEREQAEQP
jgi:D-glycero-D-manno-heptose 1,7-bisphosphate phosphatase